MEINRYYDEYKKHSPKEFFDWLSKGKVMEVRFLSNRFGEKFNSWQLIKDIAYKIKAFYRFNSIYINSFEQLREILLFKVFNYPATKYYNIFVGVNPRRKVFVKSKNGLLRKSYYGGIAGTSHIQTILCDIEHKTHSINSSTEKMLEECIEGAKFLVKALNLEDYYINISGNGTHLYFSLDDPIELPIPSFTEYEDKIKYNLKEDPIYTLIKTYNRFIEKLNKILKSHNDNLIVDEGAKDISRIARPVGSWNVKVDKTNRAIGTVAKLNKFNKGITLKFLAEKPILNKVERTIVNEAKTTKKHRYNVLNIEECPLYKLLTSQYLPSLVSRNHYLEQSFARILRDNEININDIHHLISKIDIVQRKGVQVDPDYLDDDNIFNSEMVNSYCIACKIDLVYPLLEDVPAVTSDFITDEHYKTLNSYSSETIAKILIKKDLIVISNYLHLKNLIRNLIDEDYSKFDIFFYVKTILTKEWDYYHRNRIVKDLLNKTRKIKK